MAKIEFRGPDGKYYHGKLKASEKIAIYDPNGNYLYGVHHLTAAQRR